MKLIALLAFPFLLFLIASTQPPSTRMSAAEKLTPSYTGGLKERLAAREISTSEFKELLRRSAAAGRPLLINFWATWCHGCRQEMPDLVKISRQYRARGLVFVTVSMDKPTEIDKGVPEFLRQVGGSLKRAYLANPSDADAIMRVADAAWEGQMPATFLYDKHGNLAYSHKGVITPSEVQAAIEKVLAEQRPPNQ